MPLETPGTRIAPAADELTLAAGRDAVTPGRTRPLQRLGSRALLTDVRAADQVSCAVLPDSSVSGGPDRGCETLEFLAKHAVSSLGGERLLPRGSERRVITVPDVSVKRKQASVRPSFSAEASVPARACYLDS